MPEALEDFLNKHRAEAVTAKVEGREFRVFKPKFLEDYIIDSDPEENFPMWARVWEGAVALATYLARLPATNSPVLELGAGLGFSSIVGLSFGHTMHITEWDQVALEYIKANLIQNGLINYPHRLLRLNWSNKDTYKELPKYSLIVGSEIIYRDKDIEGILQLLDTLLEKSGYATIVGGVRPLMATFIKEAQNIYDLRAKYLKCSSDDREEQLVLLELHQK